MESGAKEKTVVVTTSQNLSKSQHPPQPQPLLLTASPLPSSSSSAAALAAAQYLKQNSSSDILRQSFALKPNMPSSAGSASSITPSPRPIAPAPPGVLKATALPTIGIGNAANLTNVASIIRAPGAAVAAASSTSGIVGYSGIVGVASSNPRTVMMTPNSTSVHSLTAPGAILRYPLAQIPTARLPTAALAGSSTDPGGRFQVTIVPSRASPTSSGVVPGVAGVPGIVQLQTRPPSVTIPQQGHYVTALPSSSGKTLPIVTSSLSTTQLIPQLTASLSQNQMLQQAQLQQIFQASKSASVAGLKGVTASASAPQIKTDRVVPVTTVCLVPNIVPIAKVYPQKPGAVSSLADSVISSSSAVTNASAATNAVISQLLANRSGASNTPTILPIQIQEQIQRQLISGGSIAATSGIPAPITQSVYLPIPASSAAAAALMAGSSASTAGVSSKASSIVPLKIPASAAASGLTNVSAAMLSGSSASAINLAPLASSSGAVSGAAQFLPYYASSISGSTLQSLGVGSTTVTTASFTSGRTSGPNQATTALLVSAAASLAGAVPVSVTGGQLQQQPKKALPALPISTSTISPHHIAPGGGIYPALNHPLSSQQSIPILKVPSVGGSGTLAGMMAAAASQQVVNSAASTPVLIPSSTALAVSSSTLQQLQQHSAMAVQPQSFGSVSTPLTVLPRPILVSTTLSSGMYVIGKVNSQNRHIIVIYNPCLTV